MQMTIKMTDSKDEMQLKPCPFCGNSKPIDSELFVSCPECEAEGPFRGKGHWNNRTESPPMPDDVAEAVKCARDWLTIFGGNDTKDDEWLETLIRAASTPSADVQELPVLASDYEQTIQAL